MSRFLWLFVGMVALVPVAGSAVRLVIDLDDRCWEVSGEALYWRPYAALYQYGVERRDVADGVVDMTDLLVRPDFHWGFRLGGSMYTHDCCHLFLVDWYYLGTSDRLRRTTRDTIIFPENTPVETAPTVARVKSRYNRVNIRVGRYVSAHCNSLGYVFGGLRYVDIERQQEANIVIENPGPEPVASRQKSQFEGAAFEVGYGAHVTEPCGFSLFGHVAGLMGIGKRTVHQQLVTGQTSINYIHPGKSACIIGTELRLGLEWRYECRCYWFTLRAGYEMHQYFDALRFMAPVTDEHSPAVRTTELVNAGFGGPFFGASLRF